MTTTTAQIHMPFTDAEVKAAVDEQQRKVDKITKRYLFLSNASYAIAAFILFTTIFIAIKGNPHEWTLHFIIIAVIIAYKGFGWIWESQQGDIRMAEWMQDNGLRALNEKELHELMSTVEPFNEAKRTLHLWLENNLVVRIRDRNHIEELRGLTAKAIQQNQPENVLSKA